MGREPFNMGMGGAGEGRRTLHWEEIPSETLEGIERDYRRARRIAVLGQWFNVAALLLLALCALFGVLLWNHFRVFALDGMAGFRQFLGLMAFVAVLGALASWLWRIRREVQGNIDRLTTDLKEIASVLWFRKQNR